MKNMIYLVLFFAILFFILAWRRLDLAVMFLIAALPAYLIRFSVLGLPLTLLEVMIWEVFIAWFLKNYGRIFENIKIKIRNYELKTNNRYPFDREIVLLLLISLTAVGIAGFGDGSFGIWKAYFFEPVLFFIVVFNVMYSAKGMEKIFLALAISAGLVSLLALLQKFTGVFIDNPSWAAESTRRVVSFFGYPNAVGLYLGPIILVMTGWFMGMMKNFQITTFKFKNFQTIFIAATIFLSTLAIYFAKSKGALLGVAAGLFVFGLLAGKKIRWATIIITLIFGIGVIAYQPARDLAMENITFANKSGQIRKTGWSESWKMLKDGRLLTGAGLANYKTTVAPYHKEGFFIENKDADWLKKIRASAEYRKQMWQPLEIYLYPHNIILNFWSELGLAGLLLFIWIIGKYFLMGTRGLSLRGSVSDRSNLTDTEKYLNIGLICAMVTIVVHGIVDVPYFKNDLSVMFWLLVVMMGVINLKFKNLSKN